MRMSTVTQSSVIKSQPGIGVSFMTGSDINGCILQVYRHYDNLRNHLGGFGRFKHADCHGKVFNNIEEATKFCLSRGYLMQYYPKSWKMAIG